MVDNLFHGVLASTIADILFQFCTSSVQRRKGKECLDENMRVCFADPFS